VESILSGFSAALALIGAGDRELLRIIWMSLKVSGSALLIATLLGLPLAAWLGLKRFWGRGLIINLLNTFMGLPPVVVGLFVYLLLSRKGPLGFMGLLYSPAAMVLAQTILAFPIVSALCHAAIVNVSSVIRQAARTLGATPRQEAVLVIREARYGIMAGIIAGFGRVMAEVGAILMVGGNIAGYTRVMTTTIALETDKGNFELAIALGLILLAISFAVTTALRFFQRMGRAEPRGDTWA
jgi:tungstate transport system permease protein